jgi:hypothetical protein
LRQRKQIRNFEMVFIDTHQQRRRSNVLSAIMARRTVTHRWFVSVKFPRPGRLAGGPARETKTFATEAEAKQYAKEMLSEKNKILAGTLLSADHPIRRFIPASELHRWIED